MAKNIKGKDYRFMVTKAAMDIQFERIRSWLIEHRGAHVKLGERSDHINTISLFTAYTVWVRLEKSISLSTVYRHLKPYRTTTHTGKHRLHRTICTEMAQLAEKQLKGVGLSSQLVMMSPELRERISRLPTFSAVVGSDMPVKALMLGEDVFETA
jgi:hypothetical protein